MRTGQVQFFNQNTRLSSDCFTVSKTETAFERTCGLLKLPALSEKEGLWITGCNSVHTFGMAYALDIIYLNKGLQIRKIIQNLKPSRFSLNWLAQSVLELQAGMADKHGLMPGDKMHWKENA